VYKNMNLQ